MKKRISRYIGIVIRLAVLILAAMTIAGLCQTVWKALIDRGGLPGGELLIFPMIPLLIYVGWTARKDWVHFKRRWKEMQR